MKKLLLIFVLAAFSSPSIAADKDYTMCSTWGYFMGHGDKFLEGLAGHVAAQKN